MTVSTVRTLFPNPTPEQEMLIGPSCLALAKSQRSCIEAVKKGVRAWLTDATHRTVAGDEMTAIDQRIQRAVNMGRRSGLGTGLVVGGIAGMGIAIYTLPHPLVMVGAGFGGGVMGAAGGVYIGGDLALKHIIEDLSHSSEFRLWRLHQYQDVVFPALLEFYSGEVHQLECSLSKSWMMEPVRAPDGEYYEKESIMNWLRGWDRTNIYRIPEERAKHLHLQSPTGKCAIPRSQLQDRPNHYEEIFDKLRLNYNSKVVEQQTIVEREKIQPSTEQTLAEMPAGVRHVVTFYKSTQKERDDIARAMIDHVTASQQVPRAKLPIVTELLTAASTPPDPI